MKQTATHTSPILEACGLGRHAATNDTWLLRDVSLDVCAGERLVIVGPSGSGKTLLLRCLAYLDPWDEGSLRWTGTPLSRHLVPLFRSRVVYLHQRPSLVEGTVADNLKFPLSFAVHQGRRFDEARVVDWLQSLGRPPEFLEKSSRDLSGGEAQITALLRAMQLEPDVLLLDEPTAALDQTATQGVEQCALQWCREAAQRRTIVWVSHDQEQAARVANRVITIHAGRLVSGA
ncbi:MAG: ABC transporter ATP-binding protein [Pirellulaceae bacterium]